MALTPRQERFCEEYLVDFNGSAAAIRAGYAAGSASVQAARLLANAKVHARLVELKRGRSDQAVVDERRVLAELLKLGFSNMRDFIKVQADGTAYVDLSQLTRDQAAAITEITVEEYTEGRGDAARAVKRTKFKLADKRSALVDIGRHLGMFDERVRLMGPGGGAIEVEQRSGSEPDFDSMTDEELDDWYARERATRSNAN